MSKYNKTPTKLSDLVSAGKKHISKERALEAFDASPKSKTSEPAKKEKRVLPSEKPKSSAAAPSLPEKRRGRPPGARNLRTRELIDGLAPLDIIGIKALKRIIRDPMSPPDLVLKAIKLSWEYRHGKPRELSETEGVPISYGKDGAPQGRAVGETPEGHVLVEIGGDEENYIASLRRLNS